MSSTYFRVLVEFDVDLKLFVKQEKISRDRTHPCGTPVLEVRGWEVMLVDLTTRLLSFKKSRIQGHRNVLTFMSWSFLNSLTGSVVCNSRVCS